MPDGQLTKEVLTALFAPLLSNAREQLQRLSDGEAELN